MTKKKIIFFHLLNNYSGSPLVLKNIINSLLIKGYDIELFTSKTEGHLSFIHGIKYHFIPYKWNQTKVIRLIYYLYAQFFILIKSIYLFKKKNVLFYINTLLPFSAAISGKILKVKILYHLHEHYSNFDMIHKIENIVKNICSTNVIYVSKYLANKDEKILNKHIVYNFLNTTFKKGAINHFPDPNSKNILMITSLKKYKGVYQFIELSKLMKDYNFILIVGSSGKEFKKFTEDNILPKNLEIHFQVKDTSNIYKRASILLNLSLPDLVQETFGMTILEALTFGIPVIVPPVGGPLELVDNGINGFLIDPFNLLSIKEKIIEITNDKYFYKYLSINAKEKAKFFNEDKQIKKIINIINKI